MTSMETEASTDYRMHCDNHYSKNHSYDGDSCTYVMEEDITPKVAVVVHLCLMFFTGLFALAIVASVMLVQRHGLVVFLAVVFVSCLCLGTVYAVGHLIIEEEKLKEARRTVDKWQRMAKAVIVEELQLFKMDIQEQFLLMDGSAEDIGDNEDKYGARDIKKKKKRSKILGVLLIPFGGFRKRRKRKLERKMTAAPKSEVEMDNMNSTDVSSNLQSEGLQSLGEIV